MTIITIGIDLAKNIFAVTDSRFKPETLGQGPVASG